MAIFPKFFAVSKTEQAVYSVKIELFPELFINKIFEYTFVQFVSDQSLFNIYDL